MSEEDFAALVDLIFSADSSAETLEWKTQVAAAWDCELDFYQRNLLIALT